MFLYWSTFTDIGTPGSPHFRPTAMIALPPGCGTVDLRADATQVSGHCLVGSPSNLASPPAGVTLLLNTATDLDIAIPTGIRTTVNTALGITIPNGTTWRQGFRRLFRSDGVGKWGTIFDNLEANFGPAGRFNI